MPHNNRRRTIPRLFVTLPKMGDEINVICIGVEAVAALGGDAAVSHRLALIAPVRR
jgi:hypothetical protein